MKKVCVLLLLLTCSLFGVKKQKASIYDYGNANDPDKDKDFEISRSELRIWCPAFVRVHYTNPVLTQKFPAAVRTFNECDEDKDKVLSSSEYRKFTKKMDELFEKIYEQFKKDYDANKNGRLDKSELIDGRKANEDYFSYAVPLTEEMNQVEEGKNPVEKKKVMQVKALDDIYN